MTFQLIAPWLGLSYFHMAVLEGLNQPLIVYKDVEGGRTYFASLSKVHDHFRKLFNEHYESDGDSVWEETMFTAWVKEHKQEVSEFIKDNNMKDEIMQGSTGVTEAEKETILKPCEGSDILSSRTVADAVLCGDIHISMCVDWEESKDSEHRYAANVWLAMADFNKLCEASSTNILSNITSLEVGIRDVLEQLTGVSIYSICTDVSINQSSQLYFRYKF